MKKMIVFGILALSITVAGYACPFELTNDSPYKEIYITQNTDLDPILLKTVLDKEVKQSKLDKTGKMPVTSKAVKSSRTATKEVGKVTGMFFNIYTPSAKEPGKFEWTYNVSINFCAVEPEDLAENNLTYSQIVNHDLNMKRFVIKGPGELQDASQMKQEIIRKHKTAAKTKAAEPKKQMAKQQAAKKSDKKAAKLRKDQLEMKAAPYVVTPEGAAAAKVKSRRAKRRAMINKESEGFIEKDMPSQPEYFMGNTERYPMGILP